MIDHAELISEYLDDRITAARFDDLQNVLRSDPALRRQLLDRAVIDQHLREPISLANGAESDDSAWWNGYNEVDSPSPAHHSWRWQPVAAMAALICLVGLIGLITTTTNSPQQPTPAAVQGPSAVALLTNSHGAVFADDSQPTSLGGRLSAGPIRLVSGTAQVMFDSTAVVDLVGPCEFEIVGPNRGQLRHGEARAFVPAAASGFTLATPHGSIVDLGTAFEVTVDPPNDTIVRVIEGRVAVLDINGLNRNFLAGDEVSLNDQGITSVRQNLLIVDVESNSGHEYTIEHHALNEDAPAHSDRNYQWNGLDDSGIPAALHGADYVRTAMSDKNKYDLHVTVTLSRPARLYVFLSDRCPVPTWVTEQGFVDTGWKIGLDAAAGGKPLAIGPGQSIDVPYTIWAMNVPEAGRVTFGPVQAEPNPQAGTYGIAATPLPENDETTGLSKPALQPQ